MLDRIAEWILAIPNSVPILLGADPEHAALVRAMAALLLIVFVVYVIAMRPFRGIIDYIAKKVRKPTTKTKG
jgi:hypothetical protein